MSIVPDNRSKNFAFVPFCSLAQAFHAQGLVKYEWKGMITPVIQELMNADVNIIQMPCAETLFNGMRKGLSRVPMGRSQYDTPRFRAHCRVLAQQVYNQIEALLANEYAVLAILGMEYSPSCAVNLQYTRKGTIHQKGFFMDELHRFTVNAGLSIPFIGINRRGMKRTVSTLHAALSTAKQLSIFGD